METKRTVLLTGSSGLIGSALIKRLTSEPIRIIAVTSNVAKLKELESNNITLLSNDAFIQNGYDEHVDVAIHCAFARSGDPKLIASSILFSSDVFQKFKEMRIPKVVNISSQSVYASLRDCRESLSESSEISPFDLYGMGKYASEVLFNSIFAGSAVNYLSIRLASVMENARFPYVFVNNVIAKKSIVLYDGSQIVSFVDLRDVIEAFCKIIEAIPKHDEYVYNLGTDEKYSILDIANLVNARATMFSLSPVQVLINPPKTKQPIIAMDSAKFKSDFEWVARYSISDMIDNYFRKLLKGHIIV